jgi:hypothetical protein
MQADEHGEPLNTRETNRFRSAVFNHTIAPRDAELVRYMFDVPADLAADAMPLRVTARLRHRSRNLELYRFTCADKKTTRGRDFAKESERRSHMPLDACAPEPVTDVSESEVWIGTGSEAHPVFAGKPRWRRLYDHGLGALHALQEQVDDARPSLERALAELPESSARERAVVMGLFAQVAARQGRTDEVMQWLDRAGALAPGHPALAHTRGEALSNVWRWKEATAPLAEAVAGAPLDYGLWMHLSVAYGSAGDPVEALDAARHGLALQPRDPDMLRTQALALEALHAPPDDVEHARAAYLAFRTPDDAPKIKSQCSMKVPGCALERIPVHIHPMRSSK